MPLKKEFTHRLIKTFQLLLPVVVVALVVFVGWNYWTKVRFRAGLPNLSKLPKELALRTENFNFSKTQGTRTVFTIHADTNLGFSDEKNMLEGVEVIIYGDNPSDPPRKLKSKNCTYNQKTDDMECSGNVELQLDDATTVRTEAAVYSHVNQTVTASTPSQISRTGSMTGEAKRLDYSMNSGLLRLTGDVKMHSNEGVQLESGSAVFQEKENWATASDAVLMKSKNGWIRGQQARADLTPVTYQPRTVVVEGNVSSESTAADTGATWALQSNWVQASLSPKGVVEHVLARTSVELTKRAPDGTMVMSGNEIETQMNDTGRIDLIQARQNARMKFGDDRLLTAETIWANTDESVSTTGASVLQVGDARITGSVFSIQNGDLVTFHTDKRATLAQQDRVTTADVTDAQFQNSQLVSLVQTGHFTVKQGDQTGKANKAIIENSGDLFTLEGAAMVSDPKMQVEASTIQIDDKTKTKTATKNVKTVSTESGERVLVTAEQVIATEEKALYSGNPREKVHLYRGSGFIEAEKVEGPIGSKVFRATAIGHVFSTLNNIRAWADRLEYDDGIHIAHYIGSVTALKQDMRITAADMVVKLNADGSPASGDFTESGVQEITATGKVLVTRGNSRGTGDQAVYDADTQQVVLTGGHPEVTDGQGTTTRGPRITVNVSGDRMTVVEGSGSERAVTTHRVKP